MIEIMFSIVALHKKKSRLLIERKRFVGSSRKFDNGAER